MNASMPLIAAAALLVAGCAAQPAAERPKPSWLVKNEARLEKLLEGRTAGEPTNCIPAFQSDKMEVIAGVAMVYGWGDTLYVSRPTNPQMLRRDDIVIINRLGGQLCTTDVISTVDRMSGFMTGVVFLEKFVPYKKPN